MNVLLRGSSPATMAAGILLLSRARAMGQGRIRVEILGDPVEIGAVEGPAILHSAPVASCGVGRELGHGALVVVPGPATSPVAVSLSPDGRDGWFYVDRTGEGVHAATRAFQAARRDTRVPIRHHVRQFQRALGAVGCATEPAVLDLLFGAPAPPLMRLAVALRAGRSLSGDRGAPVTGYLVGEPPFDGEETAPPTLEQALARLAPSVQGPVASWFAAERRYADEVGDASFLTAVSEIASHLALLPSQGILPPLPPCADAVAFGLGRALAASQGNHRAHASLLDTYKFLGGTFVSSGAHPIDLPSDLPPEDRLGRWAWFCSHVAAAADKVDAIWRDLMDPPQ
jgi:hypothetical protein